jgi:regulatory protein
MDGEARSPDAPPRASVRESTYDDAVELLARRPLSELELRGRLDGRGHDPDDVARVLGRLRAASYLDDERLALDLILFRSRKGHGPERTSEEIRRRGVGEEAIRRAWEAAARDHDIDPREMLRLRVRRHLQNEARPLDQRQLRRVYNALLRAGFEAADVRSELDPFLDEPGPRDDSRRDDDGE